MASRGSAGPCSHSLNHAARIFQQAKEKFFSAHSRLGTSSVCTNPLFSLALPTLDERARRHALPIHPAPERTSPPNDQPDDLSACKPIASMSHKRMLNTSYLRAISSPPIRFRPAALPARSHSKAQQMPDSLCRTLTYSSVSPLVPRSCHANAVTPEPHPRRDDSPNDFNPMRRLAVEDASCGSRQIKMFQFRNLPAVRYAIARNFKPAPPSGETRERDACRHQFVPGFP